MSTYTPMFLLVNQQFEFYFYLLADYSLTHFPQNKKFQLGLKLTDDFNPLLLKILCFGGNTRSVCIFVFLLSNTLHSSSSSFDVDLLYLQCIHFVRKSVIILHLYIIRSNKTYKFAQGYSSGHFFTIALTQNVKLRNHFLF